MKELKMINFKLFLIDNVAHSSFANESVRSTYEDP